MAELRWATGTHEGQVREVNEDAAFANPYLFVVADGMGGHLAGEVASSIAINTLEAHLDANGTNSLDDLVAAISIANQTIFTDAHENPDHSGMGTTITAIAVITDRYDGEALGVANVGDSRIYLLRHNRLRQVTIDHSFVQELIAEGAISRDEARNHPRRNIVTRGLGIESAVRVDSWTMPLIRGDRYVLCSDGLSDYVTEDVITGALLRHPEDPAAAVVELIDLANQAGGPDNITVVLVDVLDGDDPPDPTEEIDVVPAWFDDDEDVTADTLIVTDPDPEADIGGADDEQRHEIPSPATANDDGSPKPTRKQRRAQKKAAKAAKKAGKKRTNRVVQMFFFVGIAALLIGGFALLAGWARSGYFVAFDEAGQVTIYQGREQSVLWFNPTEEAHGPFRDELDQPSVERVEARPNFGSFANAQRFITDQLSVKETEEPEPSEPASATTGAPTSEPSPVVTTSPASVGG